MNINVLMQQAQKMQRELQKAQKELNSQLFLIESAGGAVKVSIYGSKEIEKIDIDRDAIDPDDKEMLEDMLKIALNDAIRQIEDKQEKLVKKYTGGMSIPGF
ncbi:MAG: YbaB/EbfC family nucleoid-associated protein [Bacillales bacterium]|nr:YbaB/EbfC family nucleoid-associated protein [Bacillales bacterium]